MPKLWFQRNTEFLSVRVTTVYYITRVRGESLAVRVKLQPLLTPSSSCTLFLD